MSNGVEAIKHNRGRVQRYHACSIELKQAYAPKYPAESHTLQEVHSKEKSYMFIDMDENNPCLKRAMFRNPHALAMHGFCIVSKVPGSAVYVTQRGDVPSTSSIHRCKIMW